MYFNKDVGLCSVFQILTNTVVFKLKDKGVEFHASLESSIVESENSDIYQSVPTNMD